jgi:antitoxin (DNA-binding transcriptional repressor) of toxin-antitoxin stability system
MKYLNIQDNNLSLNAIIAEVTTSQSEVTIILDGLPVAKIVPCQNISMTKHYPLRGKPITIASDFDEPMTELWEVFLN